MGACRVPDIKLDYKATLTETDINAKTETQKPTEQSPETNPHLQSPD